MENRIITISREFGSGGREIGRMVAEKLGIECYDSDLIQRIVEKSGLKADYVKEGGEDTVGGWFSTFLADRTIGKTEQDKLWEYQSQVIAELADKEACVIVGRCADYILRARADCLTVFIHADPEKRAARAVKARRGGMTSFPLWRGDLIRQPCGLPPPGSPPGSRALRAPKRGRLDIIAIKHYNSPR